MPPGPWFNIKMSSYQYWKSHCGDKTVIRSSYLHNGIPDTGKMTSLYWFGPQHFMISLRPHNSGLEIPKVSWRIESQHTAMEKFPTLVWLKSHLVSYNYLCSNITKLLTFGGHKNFILSLICSWAVWFDFSDTLSLDKLSLYKQHTHNKSNGRFVIPPRNKNCLFITSN